MNSIFKRYSVRKYTDQKISDENIKLLLKSAMQAPSAGNQQPWRFTVITNKEKLKELALISPYSKFVKESNLCIIVSITDNVKYKELAPIDAAIAAENILIEAVELGFGGTYLAVYPFEDRINSLKNILNTKDLPSCIISLGYPSDSHEIQDRFDEEKVKYVR